MLAVDLQFLFDKFFSAKVIDVVYGRSFQGHSIHVYELDCAAKVDLFDLRRSCSLADLIDGLAVQIAVQRAPLIGISGKFGITIIIAFESG